MNILAVYGWQVASLVITGSVVAIGAIWGLTGACAGAQVAEPDSAEPDSAEPDCAEPDCDDDTLLGRQVAGANSRPAGAASGLETEGFAFSGRHLIASYTGCSLEALRDVEGLTAAMHEAVAASGATLLQSVRQIFPPYGMTAVMLLSESHASIHTYPEHHSCFVDIFTCGSNCQVEAFDAVLRGYLRPLRANRRIIERHDEMVDEASLGGDGI